MAFKSGVPMKQSFISINKIHYPAKMHISYDATFQRTSLTKVDHLYFRASYKTLLMNSRSSQKDK